MKTNELTGAMLDYWVARAGKKGDEMRWEQQGSDWIGFGTIGSSPEFACWIVTDATLLHDRAALSAAHPSARFYSPSTNWAQGGPIIERELSGVFKTQYDVRPEYAWTGRTFAGFDHRGPTPLIAAMRAYVASTFGNEVEDIK